MNKKISRVNGLLAIIAIMALVTGCVEAPDVGAVESESKSVDLGGAESVRVEIKMGAGELKVAGGADKLLEADFVYNVVEWRPEVEYSVSGSKGQLTIQQPSDVVDVPASEVRYVWDLMLNNDVPLELSIILGAGNNYLELGGLSLTKLDVVTGAGGGIIDLTGDWANDLDASIKGGVGRLILRLPKDVGVRVDVAGSVGQIRASELKRDGSAYVNDIYWTSRVTLNISVTGHVGEITLDLD